MAQNSIWILKGQTCRALAARVSWNKRSRNFNMNKACNFFQKAMPEFQKISTPKSNHSKDKKQKSSRLISRHVRSKKWRNGKKRLQ